MQRSKHLEPLSHDHFEGLLVAKRIRAGLAGGASAGTVAAYVGHFWEHYLTRHFRQEEELLLPLASATGADALGERMADEHRSLRDLAAALREEGPARRMLLETFAAKLKDHIRFEERELFPALEQRADEADLARVSEQLQAAHVDADLEWDPPFWE